MGASEPPPTSPRSRVVLLLAFAAVYLVWGTTFLAIRYAVETIPPLTTAAVRHGVAGGVLLGLARLRGYRPRRGDWVAGSVQGALFFLIGHGLLHWAEQHISSGLAAVLIATEPLWILAIGTSLGRQRFTRANVAGLLLGLAGVALLTLPEAGAGRPAGWAILATLLSSLAWALGVAAGPFLKLPEEPLGRAAVAALTGGAMLLALAAATGELGRLRPSEVSARSALGLAYLISFGSVIAFAAFTWLLQHVSPTVVATHAFVNPIVAIVVGWAWAGEPLRRELAVATVAIVAAVALVQGGERSGPGPSTRPRNRLTSSEAGEPRAPVPQSRGDGETAPKLAAGEGRVQSDAGEASGRALSST